MCVWKCVRVGGGYADTMTHTDSYLDIYTPRREPHVRLAFPGVKHSSHASDLDVSNLPLLTRIIASVFAVNRHKFSSANKGQRIKAILIRGEAVFLSCLHNYRLYFARNDKLWLRLTRLTTLLLPPNALTHCFSRPPLFRSHYRSPLTFPLSDSPIISPFRSRFYFITFF